MKKITKKTFVISLQFFASDDNSLNGSSDIVSDAGDASPEQDGENRQPSVDTVLADDQAEAEFEKLIKGGKFENAFKKRTQSIIDKRFKTLKTLEDAQAKQQPIMNFLSEKYGIDSSDTSRLLEQMQKESEINKANAESPDIAKKEQMISEKARILSQKWASEGEMLKKHFPDFDFRNEMKNPLFSSLLKNGMPLRKAYTAAHSDELIRNAVQGTAQRVAEQTLKSIRAQGSRVAENGLHNGAGFVRKTDVSSLTGEEIRSILKQVENGTKIRF
ncbi:MAG: hypothetical protein IJ292_01395 [Clostridia bacterium]|nr:hypothetical protein [Clostridia bacterium]